MKQTAIVIAPGRGTYNKAELGYLARHHPDAPFLGDFDDYRRAQGQDALSTLDGAARFSAKTHTRGDNASALIYACALADFGAIDRDKFDILGVTGNSMGWYTALACAGALGPMAGLQVVNTMGTLMHEHMIGGQLIYPFVDDDWRDPNNQREALLAQVATINARPDHVLGRSIDLGGMLVLAGNEAGLSAFEQTVPTLQDRYPMRLPNHGGFHTHLQKPVSDQGLATLGADLFQQPNVPIIDGRGAIWHPKSSDLSALHAYTLGHQVIEPFDFTAAVRVAVRELMPDVVIILGPGTTLGGATAQSLVRCNWRGWQTKSQLQEAAKTRPRILSMGQADQRAMCVGQHAQRSSKDPM